MFIFTGRTADAPLEAETLQQKGALTIEEYVVVTGASKSAGDRQITGVGGRVKPTSQRTLLVLPLPATSNENHTVPTPSIQIIDVGETSVQFLRDARTCFPSLVNRPPMVVSDSEEESDGDSPDAKKQRTNESIDQSGAPLSEDTTEYATHVRAKILQSYDMLFAAFTFASESTVREAFEHDTSMYAQSQILCIDLPPSTQSSTSETTELNFGLLFAHTQPDDFLLAPTPRVLQSLLSPSDEDSPIDIFQDATIISFNSRREATEHGGGKSSGEMLDNIRKRHASGTFRTLVKPSTTWKAIVEKYASTIPAVEELHGTMRLRRMVGKGSNESIRIALDK